MQRYFHARNLHKQHARLARAMIFVAIMIAPLATGSQALAAKFKPEIGVFSESQMQEIARNIPTLEIRERDLDREISKARGTFFQEYPNGDNIGEATKDFATVLMVKDIYILVKDYKDYGDGVDERSLGWKFQKHGRLDYGIGDEAYPAFQKWFLSFYDQLEGDPFEDISPDRFSNALKKAASDYNAYKKVRDREEFLQQGISKMQLTLAKKIRAVTDQNQDSEKNETALAKLKDKYDSYCRSKEERREKLYCLRRMADQHDGFLPFDEEMNVLKKIQAINLNRPYAGNKRRSDEYERRTTAKRQIREQAAKKDYHRMELEDRFVGKYCREYASEKKRPMTMDDYPVETMRGQFTSWCQTYSEEPLDQCVERALDNIRKQMVADIENNPDRSLPLTYEEREETQNSCEKVGEEAFNSCYDKNLSDGEADKPAILSCMRDHLGNALEW